jgi:hypothetical protein
MVVSEIRVHTHTAVVTQAIRHAYKSFGLPNIRVVTLPRIVTPYRNSVGVTRDRVTYQKLVTR